MPQDILFKTDDYVFSYRVAGIIVQNGRVLLQKPDNDPGYAFPGGHVAFGETHAQTLEREFREEIGAQIAVGPLVWVGELFFPWGHRSCHQICFYYLAELSGENSIPLNGLFRGMEEMEGNRSSLNFIWVDIARIEDIALYPTQAKQLLRQGFDKTTHFVYRETEETL